METALITGANRGIGLALARQLKDRGYQVIGACRTASPELHSLGVQIEEGVDVSRGDSLRLVVGGGCGGGVGVVVRDVGVGGGGWVDGFGGELGGWRGGYVVN